MLFKKKPTSFRPRTIFITGASTGIGFHAAQQLTIRGHRVIASCRKQEDVDRLNTLGLDAIIMDLASEKSIEEQFQVLLNKTQGQLDVLINNAGFGQMGALEDVPSQALRAQFETNVFGLMHLTQLAIRVMRQQHDARLILVSSILGIISLPYRGAYNASKYAVEALTDTLRLELHDTSIRVACIEPGPIESHFRAHAVEQAQKTIQLSESRFKKQYEMMIKNSIHQKSSSWFTKSPQAVVNKMIHAIESRKPKAKYPVTLPAYFFIFLKRTLTTSMLDRCLLWIARWS